LTPYLARTKTRKEKNLLSSKEEEELEEDVPEVISSNIQGTRGPTDLAIDRYNRATLA